jgi:hypothetical protein
MYLQNFSIQEKVIRAELIRDYLHQCGQTETVCFSCGIASAALRKVGLTVCEVINPEKWWDPFEIAFFYGMFDSTSGHLPVFLMEKIAVRLRSELSLSEFDQGINFLKCGSGETFVCMKMAFPEVFMIPVYDDMNPATKYNEGAPLNGLVKALSYTGRVVRL